MRNLINQLIISSLKMSIFQIKEWWGTTVGSSEEFDTPSICIANIDNDPSQANKIIVGNTITNKLIR